MARKLPHRESRLSNLVKITINSLKHIAGLHVQQTSYRIRDLLDGIVSPFLD